MLMKIKVGFLLLFYPHRLTEKVTGEVFHPINLFRLAVSYQRNKAYCYQGR